MELLTKHCEEKIIGSLSCFDRVIVKGTLPGICYAEGMTRFLTKNSISVFDYANFAEPLREKIRLKAEQLAADNGLTIEFRRSSKARKEDIVKKQFDGKKTGLIYILSAMEACHTYRPWHDKISHQTFFKK